MTAAQHDQDVIDLLLELQQEIRSLISEMKTAADGGHR